MRFHGEIDDLEVARAIGKRWGFGNVVQYLEQARAKAEQAYALAFAPKVPKKERAKFIKAWKAHFNVKNSLLKEDQTPELLDERSEDKLLKEKP